MPNLAPRQSALLLLAASMRVQARKASVRCAQCGGFYPGHASGLADLCECPDEPWRALGGHGSGVRGHVTEHEHGAKLARVAPGRYETANHSIDKTPDGWRWSHKSDPSTGGEWRSSLREAKLDLEDYLKTSLKTASRHPESAIHAAADKHLNAMTLAVMYAFLKGKKVLRGSLRAAEEVGHELVTLGDLPGHEFHGNQWTTGTFGLPSAISDPAPGGAFLYHSTHIKNVSSIAEKGLTVPKEGMGDRPISLSPHLDSVHTWAGLIGTKPEETAVLRTRNRFVQLAPHEAGEYSRRDPGAEDATFKSIPASQLEVYHNGSWKSVTGKPRSASHNSDISSCVSTIHAALLESLPSVLIKTFVAGGNAGVGMLPKKMRAAGDVEGHEFHGNQWKEGEGGTLYHGTSKERAATILKEGLLTSKAGETHPDFSGSGKSYLATTKEEAKYWAEFGHGKNAAVLAVRVPKESAHIVKPDPNYTFKGRDGSTFKNEDKKIATKDIPSHWISRALSFRSLKPQVAGQPHEVIGPMGIAFNVHDPKAIAYAKEHAAELAKNLSDTSEQAIKDAVAASLAGEGSAYDAILAAVGDEARADMIARTEVMDAANQGSLAAFSDAQDAGLLPDNATKEWIASSDACDDCEELDGEQVGLDEDFSSGDDAPPAHPNCRCAIGIGTGNEA